MQLVFTFDLWNFWDQGSFQSDDYTVPGLGLAVWQHIFTRKWTLKGYNLGVKIQMQRRQQIKQPSDNFTALVDCPRNQY